MTRYYYEANEAENTEIIRRSRFLTVVKHVESEEDAAAVMNELRSKYYDATHVCYAYRIGERAQCVKFSDAGEPKGTAGAPILAAIAESECTNTLCAVVRWFGGVKLGAGGLTRAYHGCAADTLKMCGRRKYVRKQLWRVTCPIALYSALIRIAEGGEASVLDREFAAEASFTVGASGGEKLIASLSDAAGGKIKIEPLGESFIEE